MVCKNLLIHFLLGFKSGKSVPCLYTLHTLSEFILIVLYVDDLLIAGKKRVSIDRIEMNFKKRLETRDMGEAADILGFEMNPNRSDCFLFLLRVRCTAEILERLDK